MTRSMRAHVLCAMLAAGAFAGGLSATGTAVAQPTLLYKWDGCYVGGFFAPILGSNAWVNATDGFLGTVQGGGVSGGGQIGCNHRYGVIVLGIVAEGGISNFQGEFRARGWDFTGRVQGYEWLAGRVGVTTGADDQSLWYIKAGIAAAQYRSTSFWPELGNAFFQNNSTRFGPGVGVGFETVVAPSWTLMFEFSGYFFGSTTVTLTSNNNFVPLYPVTLNQSTVYSMKLGLNYHLGSAF
jgi:opacity protein-like surface antigen